MIDTTAATKNTAFLSSLGGAVSSTGQIGYATPQAGIYNTGGSSPSNFVLPTTTSPTHAVTTTVKSTPVNSAGVGATSPTTGLITSVAQATKAGAYDAQYGAGSFNANGGTLPINGSPDHTALTSYTGSGVPSQTTDFNINPLNADGTVNSTSLGSTSTYNDVFAQRNDYEKKLLDAYNDPALQQARQQLADAQQLSLQAQKAARDENFGILSDGNMTRDQATPFSNQANLVNSQQVANYALAENAATNKLGVVTAGQQNQIAGYNALLGASQQDIQNQLSKVPGYLGTVQSPTGELFVQTRDPLTGQVKTVSAANIYGGASGSGQNLLQSAAQSLVDGTQSPSQIAASGLNPQVIYQMANQISMSTKGVPFNAQQAEANYGATKDALVQNSTQYRTLANSQAAAVSHLNDLEQYFNQIPKTSYPAVNKVVNWIGTNLGNGALQSYQTALQTARGEVAKVLAGGGAASDADVRAANATLPDNMSAAQFQGAIAATKLLMQQKIAEYTSTSNVSQYGKSNNQGGSSLYDF